MDKLLVATRSRGKQREIRLLLKTLDCAVVFPDDVGIDVDPKEDGIEDTDSYVGNALAKARYFARISGLPTVADDSGIEVDALGGRPGVHSRRYAALSNSLLPPPSSPLTQASANNAKMLAELSDTPTDLRTARYQCSVVFVNHHEAAPESFEGLCEGVILESEDGEGGFGYDPIFFSTDLQESFGRAPQAAKDSISHRGRAFVKFVEWFEGRA